MNVELSERARKRVEELIEDGTYPSAEAVVEAALAQFEHPDFADVDFAELDRRADGARASSRTRHLDEAYLGEIRARASGIVDSRAKL